MAFSIQPIPKLGGQVEVDRWREEVRRQLNNATIDDLTDVTITTATDGDVLYYSSGWINSALDSDLVANVSGVTGATVSAALDQLDSDISGLSSVYLALDCSNDPLTRQLHIDGSADETQLLIEGHSTQTNPHILATDSAGTELFRIQSNGSGNLFFSNPAALTTGIQNLGIGVSTFVSITEGSYNVAIGYASLASLTTGLVNVALGRSTGLALTTGSSNLLIGQNAGASLTTQNYNVLLGEGAGSNSTADSNVSIGQSAGRDLTSTNNVCIGSAAGYLLQNCQQSVAVGTLAMQGNATPGTISNCVAVGYAALLNNQSGSSNAALGHASGVNVSTGGFNVLFGAASGYNITTQDGNTFIGHQAGYSNTGATSVLIGYKAGFNETAGNMLYIANSDTANPLIKGSFASSWLTFNGYCTIDGNSDAVQLKVQGHSTQTSNIFEIENSSATDLLVVDGSGNVGIGTSSGISPVASLTIAPYGNDGRNIGIYTNGSIGNEAGIFFNSTQGAGNLCEIKVEYKGTNSGALKFDTSLNERMRITEDGKVGIGTNSPNSLLELGLATENLEFVDAGSTGATEQDWIEVEVGGVQGYIRVYASK